MAKMQDVEQELRSFFVRISSLAYVVIKEDFRKGDEILRKNIFDDIDIVVLKTDELKLIKEAEKIKVGSGEYYVIRKEGNCKVRFEKNGKLVLQIDILSYNKYISTTFVEHVMKSRVCVGGIYFLSSDNELIFRIAEVVQFPKKQQHWYYLLRNWQKAYAFKRLDLLAPLYKRIIFLLRVPIFFPLIFLSIPKLKEKLINSLENIGLRRKSWLGDKFPEIIFKMNVRELISKQFTINGFNRCDSVVRLLAIENYYKINDFGWDLYNKMQHIRSDGLNDGAKERFIQLINSIQINGFDNYSEIPISRKGSILDGSHRLACAIYFKEQFVSVNIANRNYFDKKENEAVYDINWFKSNGFSEHEINLINKRVEMVIQDSKCYFTFIIWPPVMEFFSEIISDIQKSNGVLSFKRMNLKKDYFEEFVSKIYACDDIEDWKIKKKLNAMNNYNCEIGILRVFISEPNFRRKASNNRPISQQVEEIKRAIRAKYKTRIPNYIYDIAIHIGDNYAHTDEMENVITMYSEFCNE
ncbi:hypothetical protein SAMN06265379_111116 [Saccharicrinis carchari]|uniref:Uncharacterized protein n=2 Tax=Saccharicrinis carchari TaxID=1168039 RepID=A0A521EVF8_SACCC|nr:hypothetical protein SAMN06265379_111116 [Saccharicrinis carchari]